MMKGEWFFMLVGIVNNSSIWSIAVVHFRVWRSHSFVLLHLSRSEWAKGANRETDSIALWVSAESGRWISTAYLEIYQKTKGKEVVLESHNLTCAWWREPWTWPHQRIHQVESDPSCLEKGERTTLGHWCQNWQPLLCRVVHLPYFRKTEPGRSRGSSQ